MARKVKIAVLGPKPPKVAENIKPQELVDFMIDFWAHKFDMILADRPDIVVVPEACDRPGDYPLDKRLEYYGIRKNQVRDYFVRMSQKNKCNIVYSAAIELEDSTFRNASVVIDRQGNIAGAYYKNYLVVEETTQGGIHCGQEAPIIECDFGNIAAIICFDLNFDELRLKYAKAKPDLIVFSSIYHGSDVMQSYWAYTCRCHFASAVAGLPSQIRNPFGEVLAASTNYREYAISTVNLDCCFAHYDYNWKKLESLKKKYGAGVNIYDPGYWGSVLITSEIEELSAIEMASEFNIELLNDYFIRANKHRSDNLGRESF